MTVESGKKYKFGDGIRAMAKNDPDLLAKITLGKYCGLAACFVLGEIKAATTPVATQPTVIATQEEKE